MEILVCTQTVERKYFQTAFDKGQAKGKVGVSIMIAGFIERKIDTDPLMLLSPRRESPGTDMGQYPRIASEMPVPHSRGKLFSIP